MLSRWMTAAIGNSFLSTLALQSVELDGIAKTLCVQLAIYDWMANVYACISDPTC